LSAGAAPSPTADEDDGLPDFPWTVDGVEDDWPGSIGAARLGIP
jgi:hypothetical protein